MARVTANPQQNPAPSKPARNPVPPAPATAKATKLSPRKTRTNVPSTSARYFLVQLSDTAITSSSSLLINVARKRLPDDPAPFVHLLWRTDTTKKALTCTLQLERIGQDF